MSLPALERLAMWTVNIPRLLGCVYVLSGIAIVAAQDIGEVDRLLTDLRRGYPRDLRPVRNQSHAVDVETYFYLTTIKEYNEIDERLSVTGIVHFIWRDEMNVWDPANYSDIGEVKAPKTEFWTPTIVVYNAYDKMENVGEDWMSVRIYSNGTTVFDPGSTFSVICPVDVTYYPWDTQYCGIVFVPWGYSTSEVAMSAGSAFAGATYHYFDNGAWHIDGTFVFGGNNGFHNVLTVGFKIKRKPTFISVNVILPVTLMACINLAVFLLPAESGERMSFSVTVVLAIAVFLTLVADNLPKKSNPMSILSYFLITLFITNVVICLTVIGNLRLYYADGCVPAWITSCLQRLRYSCNGNTSRNRQPQPTTTNQKQTFTTNIIMDDTETVGDMRGTTRSSRHEQHTGRTNTPDLQQTSRTGETIPLSSGDGQKQTTEEWNNSSNDITWKEISKLLDTVFLGIFSVILIIIKAVFMSMLTFNTDWKTDGVPPDFQGQRSL